jgi:hypothetical protein
MVPNMLKPTDEIAESPFWREIVTIWDNTRERQDAGPS